MKIENVFGDSIVKIQCDDVEIYKNKELTKSVNQMFESSMVKNRLRDGEGDSHKGAGLTTVGQPYGIIDLPGSFDLKEWLIKQFLLVKEPLKKYGADVKFKRSWANRLFLGGQGMCHNHTKLDNYMNDLTKYEREDFCPDAVGILYVDVPENSSNLVFVRDGKEDTYLHEYDENRKCYLQPKEGELVIHSPEMWHAVSIHKSVLPRNVFVFDIDYV
jgi:hypothetical protein